MSKLGHKTKGDFQAFYFAEFAKEYFKGGNAQGRQASIHVDLIGIISGLSDVWDRAEEETLDQE